MCDTCGCNVTEGNRHLVQEGGAHEHTASGAESVSVLRSLLDENDRLAARNREHFDGHRVLAVNLMSSPGAGKTALLETTLAVLGKRVRVAVIEGDLETENDAERIRRHDVPVVQITTGTACHLDAHLVHRALHELNLAEVDLLFIENVGNLVCPASFDLGQHRNVTLLSIPEGDDKPAKYPVMFRAADLLLISKEDLGAVLPEFDPARAEAYFRALANPAPVQKISARSGTGIDAWIDWLEGEIAAHRQRIDRGETARPLVQADGAALHGRHPDAAHPSSP